MVSIINQYSLFISTLVILVVVAVFLFRKGIRLPEFIAFLVILAGVVLAWMVIRPTQTPLSGAATEVESRIGAGKPVLLEFQSPY